MDIKEAEKQFITSQVITREVVDHFNAEAKASVVDSILKSNGTYEDAVEKRWQEVRDLITSCEDPT